MQTEIEWKVHYHEEWKNALGTFQNNKAPGEDGFTVEFYTFLFFDLLGHDLVATTLANFVGKVVTFYHAFVFLPSPLFNVGFQWTFLLQYCLANIQH